MPTITLRFHIAPIPASERPRDVYTFWVTGRGYFPIDMLRHDACWPADGEQAAAISDSIGSYAVARTNSRFSIKLRSHREPTIARWSSFGWSCSADKLEF